MKNKLMFVFLVFTIPYSPFTIHCLWADGPKTISYQGRLRESGQPVSGTRSIQFKLFDASSAGTPVFDSDPQSLYVSSGIFSYQLGSNKAAGSPNFKDLSWATSTYWLEISVGGNAMTPREHINAMPYAFMASTAASLNGSGNIQITGAGNHYILNGNVGIGTMNPVGRLTINTGSSGFTASVNNMSAGTLTFANVASLQAVPGLMGKSDDHAGLYLGSGTNDTNTSGDMLFNVRENDNTDFSTTSSPAFKFQRYGTDLITVFRNGNVGIGTTNPSVSLEVNGLLKSQNLRVTTNPSDATGILNIETTIGTITGVFSGQPIFIYANGNASNNISSWNGIALKIRLDNASTGTIIRTLDSTSNGAGNVGNFTFAVLTTYVPSAGTHTFYLTASSNSGAYVNIRNIEFGALELPVK